MVIFWKRGKIEIGESNDFMIIDGVIFYLLFVLIKVKLFMY